MYCRTFMYCRMLEMQLPIITCNSHLPVQYIPLKFSQFENQPTLENKAFISYLNPRPINLFKVFMIKIAFYF